MDHQSPYRKTTLGKCLLDSLDELIQKQWISPQLAQQVALRFDKAASAAVANRLRSRFTFKGLLNSYKPCNEGWTFILKDVEFWEVANLVEVDNVKVIASKSNTAQ